jgi:hypothetical protein
MMDPNTLVALTVAAGAMASLMGTVLAPIVLMWLTSRERRREKLEDYARQDKVAAQAAEAAELLLAANVKVAATAAATVANTNQKLDEIHVAVNSNLTKATQGELEAKEQSLILMVELMELKTAAGTLPTVDVLETIDRAKMRIAQLQHALGPRLVEEAQAQAQAQ